MSSPYIFFKRTSLGACACGVEIYLSEVNGGPPSVLHHIPVCEPYKELDVISFLAHVRRSCGLPEIVEDEIKEPS
jgi:hypothetical protein